MTDETTAAARQEPEEGEALGDVDLFGERHDPFVGIKERIGLYPFTVWPLDFQDRRERNLRELVGDSGEEREGSLQSSIADSSTYKTHASIFSPTIGQWLLNCFAPEPPARVFDPFGGGGTRAVLCAKAGLHYTGVELRPGEAAAVRARLRRLAISEAQARIVEGDSREACTLLREEGEGWADFLLTCPPYWNLEKYDGGPNDLSELRSYPEFLDGLEQVVAASALLLKPGALSCWVTGLLRNRQGALVAMHHDLAQLHDRYGFELREEIIIHKVNTGAITRVGNFSKGKRLLIRIHEYAQVFQLRGGRA